MTAKVGVENCTSPRWLSSDTDGIPFWSYWMTSRPKQLKFQTWRTKSPVCGRNAMSFSSLQKSGIWRNTENIYVVQFVWLQTVAKDKNLSPAQYVLCEEESNARQGWQNALYISVDSIQVSQLSSEMIRNFFLFDTDLMACQSSVLKNDFHCYSFAL